MEGKSQPQADTNVAKINEVEQKGGPVPTRIGFYAFFNNDQNKN